MKRPRLLAFLLAASLVLESSVPVLAAENAGTSTVILTEEVSVAEQGDSTEEPSTLDLAAVSGNETEGESEAKSENGTEITTETETTTEMQTGTETEIESETTENETESEATESEMEGETESERETETEMETETELETEMETETELETEVDLETSVSANGTAQAEESNIRYIYGRELTEEEIAAQKAMEPKLAMMEEVKLDATDIYAGLNPVMLFGVEDETYDLRTKNVLSPVKNQNPWGTCWAFATMALMESSLIKQGLADSSVDLSERHLAYFVANTGYDALGNASEDTIVPPDETFYLENGGKSYRSSQ